MGLLVMVTMAGFDLLRIVGLCAGGLFLLGGSATVGSGKLLYVAACLLAGLQSVSRLSRLKVPLAGEVLLQRACGALGGLILLTLPLAILGGNGFSNWLRDSSAYILLAVLPLIGLDAGRTLSVATITCLSVIVGAAGVGLFFLEWTHRRGVADGNIGHVGFASFMLCASFFCYALSAAAQRHRSAHRAGWLVAAGLTLVLLLLTGTRTSFALLAAIGGIVGARRKGRQPLTRTFVGSAVGVALLVLLLPTAGAVLGLRTGFIQQRLAYAASFLTHPTGDQSYAVRQAVYGAAVHTFKAHPILGTGPGFLYGEIGSIGTGGFTLDTPLLLPAKFGVLGVLVIVAYWVALSRSAVRLTGSNPASRARAAGRCFAFVGIATLPFGPFMEDKGLALAVMLFVALARAEGGVTAPYPQPHPPRLRRRTS